MEVLRLLTADDEPLARELVRGYVAACEDLEVVAECSSADELAPALLRKRVDVVLLDIRMPGEDVFDVLDRITSNLPFIIFATAYDRYAARAFELNAVDYLVKPFTLERFSAAMRRVRERIKAGRPQPEVARVIHDLGRHPDRLLVPDNQRMVAIAVADINWIKAEGDYSRIHTDGRSYLVGRTLKELDARLDPDQFIRIHQSAIVRSGQIREVRPQGSNRYGVLLADGTTLIVSRTRSAALKRWML